jgi:hypothetical protein
MVRQMSAESWDARKVSNINMLDHRFCIAPMMERFAPENDCGIGVSTRSDSVMLYQTLYQGIGPLIAVYP